MKKIFLLLIICILTSCGNDSVSNGRELYKRYFNKVLKDPSSLVIYDEKYHDDGTGNVTWTIDYGAKNSFGAMDRKTIELYTSTYFIETKDGTRYNESDLPK